MNNQGEVNFNIYLNDFREQVAIKGFKNSVQKDYILKILFFSNEHLTVEQITTKVKMDYNVDVGIATVYRTMKFFEDLNVVESLDIGDGVKRYELNHYLHHDHLVCTSCGKIIEFADDFIELSQIKIAESRGFVLKDHVMTIYGLCEKCQA